MVIIGFKYIKKIDTKIFKAIVPIAFNESK